VIELDNVAYGYGDDDLLGDLSLRLQPGSFHFLTGPSGAGKSTFLKLCYLDLIASTGSLKVFVQEARDMDRDQLAKTRRRIGVVNQDCQFLDHLSVAENIALPISIAGGDPVQETQNLDDLVNWVGLKGRRNALPPQLSGGNGNVQHWRVL